MCMVPLLRVEKASFVFWLYNFDVPSFDEFALVGDINFIRGYDNRNKPGGSVNDMMLVKDLIPHLDLLEIPLRVINTHVIQCTMILFWRKLIWFLPCPLGH